MLPAAAALSPFLGGGALAAAPSLLDFLEDDAFCGPELDPCRLQQMLYMYYLNQGYNMGWNDHQWTQLQQQMLYSLLLGVGPRRRRRGLRRHRAGGLDAMALMMMMGGGGGGGGGFGVGGGMRLGGVAGGGGGLGALMAPQLGSHHLLINQPRLWYPM